MTPEETLELETSLQHVLRLLTKAGILYWRRNQKPYCSEFERVLAGEITEQESFAQSGKALKRVPVARDQPDAVCAEYSSARNPSHLTSKIQSG